MLPPHLRFRTEVSSPSPITSQPIFEKVEQKEEKKEEEEWDESEFEENETTNDVDERSQNSMSNGSNGIDKSDISNDFETEAFGEAEESSMGQYDNSDQFRNKKARVSLLEIEESTIEESLEDSMKKPLKPPQIVAHLARLIIKLFYHKEPNYRLIFELLLEGPRTKEQVKQIYLGDIQSDEDMKQFTEEIIRDLSINPNAMLGEDVMDGDMKSFALEAIDDLTFNPYGSRLTDLEMSRSLGLPLKDVQINLGKLVLDRLICKDNNWRPPKTIEQKNEERKENLRKSSRMKPEDPVLYYIDYVQFFNVALLRISKLEKFVDEIEQEREIGYACESCGEHYSISNIEVLSTQKCLRCGGLVSETQEDQNLTNISEDVARFHELIHPIKLLLERCQEFIVSKNHLYKLKEFKSKAEAEKIRQEGEKRMADELYDRKKRRRMNDYKPSEKLTSSAIPTTQSRASTNTQSSSASQLPHFLNSSKSQLQFQIQNEQQKLKEENKIKERENLQFQQQKDDDILREQSKIQLQEEQIELMEDEKDPEENEKNPLILVNGQFKHLEEITDNDLEIMTSDEYEAYEAIVNRIKNADFGEDF